MRPRQVTNHSILDVGDRLPTTSAAEFADLIKALSDRGAATTMVLVGVAEDVNALIANHAGADQRAPGAGSSGSGRYWSHTGASASV